MTKFAKLFYFIKFILTYLVKMHECLWKKIMIFCLGIKVQTKVSANENAAYVHWGLRGYAEAARLST